MQIIQKKGFKYENIKENIHQWCPFWTASAVKDFMFRTKKSRMFTGINRRKKSKKRVFVFRLQYGQKKKALNVIFSPKK